MYLFRFVAGDGTAHLGIEDDNGGRYDASRILPDAFASVGNWLALEDPLGAAETVIRVGSDERRAGSTFYVPPGVALLAPVDDSEVWASGVTYARSKSARMEESKESGGGDFYDRVYEADRPELFFKSVGWRVVAPGAPVRIRRDSTWNVPEPEMVLVLSARGEIVGVTAGNDMSSRSIEGENPLYLPQAKTYDGACALGPVIRLLGRVASPPTPNSGGAGGEVRSPVERDASSPSPPAPPELGVGGLNALSITLTIRRGGETVFAGETSTAQMKRTPEELSSWLFRETAFPQGAFLLTGTGVIPEDSFTLQSGDEVAITLEGMPTLTNTVA